MTSSFRLPSLLLVLLLVGCGPTPPPRHGWFGAPSPQLAPNPAGGAYGAAQPQPAGWPPLAAPPQGAAVPPQGVPPRPADAQLPAAMQPCAGTAPGAPLAPAGLLQTSAPGRMRAHRFARVDRAPNGDRFVAVHVDGDGRFGSRSFSLPERSAALLSRVTADGRECWTVGIDDFRGSLGTLSHVERLLAHPRGGVVIVVSTDRGGSGGSSTLSLARIGDRGQLSWVAPLSARVMDATVGPGGTIVLLAGGLTDRSGLPGGVRLGPSDNLLAVVSPADGGLEKAWAHSAPIYVRDFEAQMAVALNGDIVLGGPFVGSVRVGGETLRSHGGSDIYLARYSRDGVLVRVASLGTATDQHLSALRATPADGLVMLVDDTLDRQRGSGSWQRRMVALDPDLKQLYDVPEDWRASFVEAPPTAAVEVVASGDWRACPPPSSGPCAHQLVLRNYDERGSVGRQASLALPAPISTYGMRVLSTSEGYLLGGAFARASHGDLSPEYSVSPPQPLASPTSLESVPVSVWREPTAAVFPF